MVGAQVAVAELVLSLIDRSLRLLHRSLCGLEVGLRGVQLGLGAHTTVEQLLLTTGIGPGVDQLCLYLGQITLGRTQLVLLIGGVEVGQNVTLFHHRTHIVITAHDAPRNTKAQGAFITSFDTPSKAAQILDQLGPGNHIQRRANGFRRLFLRAAHQHRSSQRHHP